MRRSVALLVIVALSSLSSLSQLHLDFDALSLEDGFTSSKANAIIQDSKGFIWVGTWSGLNRYDGYGCEVFKTSYQNPASISNKEVVSLHEDRQGNIWIGTSFGLNRYDAVTGTITTYEFDSRIMSIFQDSKDFLWVGTWSNGLFRLNPDTDERTNYLPVDVISDIFEDTRNEFWVATYNGLVNLSRETGTFTRYIPDPISPFRSIKSTVVTQIVESEDGMLWVGTWGGGVNKLIPNQDKASIRFEHFDIAHGSNNIAANDVYRLHYDQFNNLWIGTWEGGLYLLDQQQQQKSPQEASFYAYKSDISDPFSISGNNITALYVDRAGLLWVGSSRIDRANIINNGIERYNVTRETNGLHAQSTVRSIGGNGHSQLLVGTTTELKIYKWLNGKYEFEKNLKNLSYRYNGYLYQSSSVLSLLQLEDGVMVGTDDAGLLFFTNQELNQKAIPSFSFYNNSTPSQAPGNKISNLYKSKKYPDVVWVGSLQNGFARCTRKGNSFEFENYRAGDLSLSDNNIRAILEDKDGIVWIGTQKGLNRFDPETGEFMHFLSSRKDTASLNDNIINALYEDNKGTLWIGTNSGVNKKEEIVLSDGSLRFNFKGFSNVNYLYNDLVMNMVGDFDNNLWVGLYGGMVKFNTEEEKIVEEYMLKEFQRVGIERNSCFRDSYGNFFFGGAHGFLSFHPDSILRQSTQPTVVITDILVYNQRINELNAVSGKKMEAISVPFLKDLVLSYKENVVTFEFSSMDFKDPGKNKFAYFLEGFDKEWNMVGTRRSATYTKIPPGKYIFMVKGANSDGVWSEEPSRIFLTITPPWWQTIYAYIIYIAFLVWLLYFFKQYSIIQIKEKGQLMLERIRNEKEHELSELKVHFFTNITHEFRTPLTLIVGPVEEMLTKNDYPSAMRKQLELVHRNTQRLLRLVNQLMEFRKVEKGKMELYLQKCDIVPVLIDLHDSFKSMAVSKQIAFSLEYSPSALNVWVDKDKFEKILFNLVSNAFKYSEDNGEIKIRAGLVRELESNGYLFVEVNDTGIGIPHEKHELIFERFYQVNQTKTQSTGGIGLYLTKAFVEQHHGKIVLESEPGKGTSFRVIIPLEIGKLADKATFPLDDQVEVRLIEVEMETEEMTGAAEESSEILSNQGQPVVLVVEDDKDLNDFITEGLSSFFHLKSASNGREGLELARKLTPDIIVTDIMMPEMDGFEMVRHLRDDVNTSHIPIVFLTAKTMREDEIEGLRLGAVDYVYKPFNMVSLRLKIMNILEVRASLQEKFRTNQLLEPGEITLTSLDETFLKKAVEAVDAHLDETDFDVDALSKVVGMTSNQTYRKIKALTGQTAKEFIRSQRLKTAAKMLLQRKRSISEIIYMVGFSSPSYFSRCFREYFGCTPSEYIEQDDIENAPE